MAGALEAAGAVVLFLLLVIAGFLAFIVILSILTVAWNWLRWKNPYGKTGMPPARRRKAPAAPSTVVIVPPEKGPQK